MSKAASLPTALLHVRTPFLPHLKALYEQAGVSREHAVTQALEDYFDAYVPANYPNVKLPKSKKAHPK